MNMQYTDIESPLGPIRIAGDVAGLRRVDLLGANEAAPQGWQRADDELAEAVLQLREYFAGSRTRFDLQLAPDGTDFDRRTWDVLLTIPHGETISYAELARRVGSPGASRAVGRANGRNPLAIVIPCHRVIASDGTLGGYAGGLPAKRLLLDLESRQACLG